jgi:hypothetical protein
MNFIEWQHECEGYGLLDLEEFLERHRGQEIIVCEEAIHQWPSDAVELRQLCGGNAQVEYLDKESPHWSDNDGLYFILRPTTKEGKLRDRVKPIHVVVYPI